MATRGIKKETGDSLSSKKKRRVEMCQIHNRELLLFCVKCDQSLCITCNLENHKQHKTEELTAAVAAKKEKLQEDRQRLQDAMSDVNNQVKSLQEERQSLREKKAAVEKSIRKRRDAILAVADKKMKEELESLKSKHKAMDEDVEHAIGERKGCKKNLSDLLQQVNNAITTDSAGDVIAVAQEMKTGSGTPKRVEDLRKSKERLLQRPVLPLNVSADDMTKTTRDYVGSVRNVEMKETKPEMKVTERFKCALDPDVEVFSLCHRDSDPPEVIVSFGRCGMNEEAPWKAFTETGDCRHTSSGDSVGKISFRRHEQKDVIFERQPEGKFITYCKSTPEHFRLLNHLSGQASIEKVIVTGRGVSSHINTHAAEEFSIQVGPQRAFDVDNTTKCFVVVEERNKSQSQRHVRLYHGPGKALGTYSPKTAYQPTDVCFYTLGGQRVLLITDELNDAIHVVTIHGKKMQFERYLCGGCPSLIQPTAITTDINGRLWVACRGGAILTLEPIA